MASDIHVALGPLGILDYKKLGVDGSNRLRVVDETLLSTTMVVTNTFAQVSSVASGATVTILSYIVPVASTFYLDLVEFSGENIATYEVYINAVLVARKRTYFNGNMADDFPFQGLAVTTGLTIELKVVNYRPTVADFEGRIIGVLV